MFNHDGIKSNNYGAPRQILFNVDNQLSVGCIVPQSLGTTVGSKKIAKAGTPIYINFGNLQTPAAAPAAASGNDPAVVANAVLLHNVDVTDGTKNGTALIWGWVNVNRLESDVASKVTPGTKIGDVQFIKG